ncbi:MAG: hypothetical protein KatS3mg096_574 [Candidatus Parcubacteria bacterium]|nr:MAG: hypothetical protein KatS3mg096_574 [Candidatus Parcubacteria bacterium]
MKITGKIKSNNGEYLAGANVYISDSDGTPKNFNGRIIGTSTDANGNFTLDSESINNNDYIRVKYIGFDPYLKRIGDVCTGGNCNLDITLQESSQLLNEFVVEEKVKKADERKKKKIFLIASVCITIALLILYGYNTSKASK